MEIREYGRGGIFHHPEHGELRNLTESARYLGISRRKFRRIAPKPDLEMSRVYPYWATRVLDILPVDEDLDVPAEIERGQRCGTYLVGELSEEELKEFHRNLAHIVFTINNSPRDNNLTEFLSYYGIQERFLSWRAAKAFAEGMLGVIRRSMDVRESS